MYISVQIYTYDLNKCCLGSDKKKVKCFAGKWKYLPQKINSEIHEARMEDCHFTCTDKVTFFPADSNTIAACCNSNKLHIIRIL